MAVLAGCTQLPDGLALRSVFRQSASAAGEGLDGKILVWHGRTGEQAEALEEILANFDALHPDLDLLVTRVDSTAMFERLLDAAHSGLGPDLFIGPNEWVVELADNEYILPIDEVMARTASIDLEGESSDVVVDRIMSRYTSTVLRTVTYTNTAMSTDATVNAVYGFPDSLNVQALYYNRSLLPEGYELPETLDDLLVQASQGTSVAIPTSFTDAFWGVPAFGGRLFEENGSVILSEGGFANWLNWLETARDIPGTLMDPNREELRNRFRAGNVAYYIGYASEYTQIVQSTGISPSSAGAAATPAAAADSDAPAPTATSAGTLRPVDVGVTLLPDGPAGNAGPLLFGNSYFFNAASASPQLALGLAIVDYTTNAENSTTLMRNGALVPANINVRVNARLDPNMASFVSQTRSSVPYPNTDSNTEWVRLGSSVFRQVMQDILSPAQAADEMTAALSGVNGFAVSDAPPSECMDVGVVTLWDAANTTVASALDSAIQQFSRECPTIIVRRVPTSEEALRTEWITATVGAGSRVDLLLAPHTLLDEFTQAEALHDLTPLLGVDVLQRFSPVALNAMRYDEKLYGLPYHMDVPILYYNRELLDAPATTLDELLSLANAAAPAALPLTFKHAAWGVAAFGGSQPGDLVTEGDDMTVDLQVEQFVIDARAWRDWLAWLRTASTNPGIWLTLDPTAALDRFASGDASYYVGMASDLPTLYQAMGQDAVGVAELPTGTDSEFRVLLDSYGFIFNANASDAQLSRALQFALFATGSESQATLVEMTQLTPSNVTVSLEGDNPISTFIDRAIFADVAPRAAQSALLEDAFNGAYALFLRDDLTPWAAARNAVQTLLGEQGEGVALNELLQRNSITFDELHVAITNLDALAEEPSAENEAGSGTEAETE